MRGRDPIPIVSRADSAAMLITTAVGRRARSIRSGTAGSAATATSHIGGSSSKTKLDWGFGPLTDEKSTVSRAVATTGTHKLLMTVVINRAAAAHISATDGPRLHHSTSQRNPRAGTPPGR